MFIPPSIPGLKPGEVVSDLDLSLSIGTVDPNDPKHIIGSRKARMGFLFYDPEADRAALLRVLMYLWLTCNRIDDVNQGIKSFERECLREGLTTREDVVAAVVRKGRPPETFKKKNERAYELYKSQPLGRNAAAKYADIFRELKVRAPKEQEAIKKFIFRRIKKDAYIMWQSLSNGAPKVSDAKKFEQIYQQFGIKAQIRKSAIKEHIERALAKATSTNAALQPKTNTSPRSTKK